MKKSDYLLWKNRIEDPYAAFLEERKADYLPEREMSLPADYCMVQKPDGRLAQYAESLITEWIEQKYNPDFIYCDEDCVDRETGKRFRPFLKPEWSPDTLQSFFYPGGLVIMKKELMERTISESGLDFNGWSPDFLYECAMRADKVSHLAKILYHSFTECDYHYEKEKIKEDLTGRHRISIVILSKDNPGMLEKCVSSLRKYTGNNNPEIIVIDNGSSPENTLRVKELASKYDFSYERKEMPFIYSALCNIGAAKASGDFLLFLNDDVEVPSQNGFLEKMVCKASEPSVGAVGLKLLYPDSGRIQHVGITDLAVGPSHKLATFPDTESYYFGRNRVTYNVLAVTGACLMVSKRKFEEVNGFDERLSVAYTDVDLCTDLLEKGYRNVVINSAFLYHHESVSRGNDVMDGEKRQRLERERHFYYEKHPFLKETGDPYYHKDLTPWKLEYEPDMLFPWEDCTERAVEMKGKRVFDAKGNILASIDQVRYCAGVADPKDCHENAAGVQDYYEVEGWIFKKGRSGLSYDPGVILTVGGREICYTAVRKYRKELPEVFAGEKRIDLSGFICRIPYDAVKDMGNAEVSACLYPICSNRCYVKRETLKKIQRRKGV